MLSSVVDRGRFVLVTVADRVARGLAGSLARGLRLPQFTLERRHALFDGLGGARGGPRRRPRRTRARADCLVGLLDLGEVPRRLLRPTVAVRVVELDQAPVGVVELFG